MIYGSWIVRIAQPKSGAKPPSGTLPPNRRMRMRFTPQRPIVTGGRPDAQRSAAREG